jgi:phospholipase C
MLNDPIKHVVVLALENRSFDHVLGGLSAAIPGLDGADGNNPRTNTDHQGNSYAQQPGASYALRYDPKHELEHVLHQLENNNTGFVEDFSRAYPLSSVDDRQEIMKYFEDGRLPALHTLAKQFGVCNRWFSSVPGPTWANRFFLHSGTSIGRVAMPEGLLDANLHWYDQTTLYDRLNERKIDWRLYYGDIPQSLILVHQLEPENVCNYCKMRQFFMDAAGDEAKFPSYCFIEPSYYQPGASDDHPPHDVTEGEKLVAEVYNALRSNGELWNTTLLIVLYDEHGGFYDHVTPPAAVAPDHYVQEYTFSQLGLRVPALLVSPFVAKGVINTQFDHTSILRYLSDKWNLGPLGARVANASSVASAFVTAARKDTPESLPMPAPDNTQSNRYGQLGGRTQGSLNAHQSALVGMTQLLESMTTVGENALIGRIKRMITGSDGMADVAFERLDDFLEQQKAKM